MDASVALVTEHNAKLQSDFEQGLLSAEAVLTAVQPVPVRIRYPTPSWIRWWKSSWGWTLLSRGGDEQGWLPYSHPDMAAARLDTKRLFSEDGCHKRLCLNYDQIWRNAFTLQILFRNAFCIPAHRGWRRTEAQQKSLDALWRPAGSRLAELRAV